MVVPIREILPLFSQNRIVAELIEIFGNLLDPKAIPWLEDLVNAHSLTDFVAWREDAGFELMSSAPPSYAVNEHNGLAHVAAGRQSGVRNSQKALDPLILVTDNKLKHL